MANIFASSQSLDHPRSRESPRTRLQCVCDPGKEHQLVRVVPIIDPDALSFRNARDSAQRALTPHKDEARLVGVPLEGTWNPKVVGGHARRRCFRRHLPEMTGDRARPNDVGNRGVAHEPSGVTVQRTEESSKIMSVTEKKDPSMYPCVMFLALALACAKPVPTAPPRALQTEAGLSAELVTQGSLSERIATEDSAEWVLFYTGEQRGDIAPCGCPSRPRGGLPRTASAVQASGPALFVNTGGWLDGGLGLDGNPIPEAELKNQWMVRGLELMNPDAVHVGFEDLPALPGAIASGTTIPLISANLKGPGIENIVYVEHRDLLFAFTGVSHTGHRSIQTPGYERIDPVSAGEDVLHELRANVDRVILFSHGATDAARRLARSGRIDVVIDTQSHRGFDAPFRVGNALWIRSHAQGLRLGELRVGASEVLDRKIDMDDALPDDPDLRALADKATTEIEALKTRLFGP